MASVIVENIPHTMTKKKYSYQEFVQIVLNFLSQKFPDTNLEKIQDLSQEMLDLGHSHTTIQKMDQAFKKLAKN